MPAMQKQVALLSIQLLRAWNMSGGILSNSDDRDGGASRTHHRTKSGERMAAAAVDITSTEFIAHLTPELSRAEGVGLSD